MVYNQRVGLVLVLVLVPSWRRRPWRTERREVSSWNNKVENENKSRSRDDFKIGTSFHYHFGDDYEWRIPDSDRPRHLGMIVGPTTSFDCLDSRAILGVESSRVESSWVGLLVVCTKYLSILISCCLSTSLFLFSSAWSTVCSYLGLLFPPPLCLSINRSCAAPRCISDPCSLLYPLLGASSSCIHYKGTVLLLHLIITTLRSTL